MLDLAHTDGGASAMVHGTMVGIRPPTDLRGFESDGGSSPSGEPPHVKQIHGHEHQYRNAHEPGQDLGQRFRLAEIMELETVDENERHDDHGGEDPSHFLRPPYHRMRDPSSWGELSTLS